MFFYRHRLLGIYLALWFLCSAINFVGALVDYPHGIRAIESRDPDTLIPLATGDDGKPREMIFTPLLSEPSNFLLALWHEMCYIEDSS